MMADGMMAGSVRKLTEDDVRRARRLASQGQLNVREFARICGVGTETLRRAVRGDTWGHVSEVEIRSDTELQSAAESSYEKLQRLLAAEKERKGAGDAMVQELTSESAELVKKYY
jgi:hypothetical protein